MDDVFVKGPSKQAGRYSDAFNFGFGDFRKFVDVRIEFDQ